MTNKFPEKIKTILEEVKKSLIGIYGNRLKGIILYGSYARGDFTDGSDIDIIILLDDVKEPLISESENYSHAIWEINLKYDIVVTVLPFSEEAYKTRRLPVILNAKREGIGI